MFCFFWNESSHYTIKSQSSSPYRCKEHVLTVFIFPFLHCCSVLWYITPYIMFHTPLPSVILYCHIPAAVSVKNWLARCTRICCRFMHPTATIQQLDLFINATDMSIISLYTVCEYHWPSVPITFYLSRDRYIEQNSGIIDCLLVKSTTYSEQENYQLLIHDLTHIQKWLFFFYSIQSSS